MDLYLDEIDKDFILVDETRQAAEQLVKSNKGSWYEHRELGLNLDNLTNGSISKVKLQKEIKEQFKLANIDATASIEFDGETLNITVDV